ncbi:MAG: GAF domain-containing protein [Janthinobacterium lividum]
MSSAPIPANDEERLTELRSYGLLDTPAEQGYDDITLLASYICETPYALVTLVDRDRQFFKSERGLGSRETNRADSFCGHAILEPETMVVPDSHTDPRFAENPLVTGSPGIRFYAGAPLITPGGYMLGTVCVFDNKPRDLRPDQVEALQALARQVMARMELGRKMRQEQAAADSLRLAEKLAAVGRMASAMAHEINNPLQSLTNLLFMVQTTDDRAERAEYLRLANEELGRVSHLVTLTLRFHSQSSGPRPVRLGETAESVLLLFRTRLEHANVKVDLRDRQKRLLVCFAEDVRQVLASLLANSLDALAACGKGKLLLRMRDGQDPTSGQRGVYLTVADTGTGIPPETFARLFQPFNTTKGIRGTGLGLWVAKGVLVKHGGKIRARTRFGGAGTGTVMRLFFAELSPAIEKPTLEQESAQPVN